MHVIVQWAACGVRLENCVLVPALPAAAAAAAASAGYQDRAFWKQ